MKNRNQLIAKIFAISLVLTDSRIGIGKKVPILANSFIQQGGVYEDSGDAVRIKSEDEKLSREDIRDILYSEYESTYNMSTRNIGDNRDESSTYTGRTTEQLPSTDDSTTKQQSDKKSLSYNPIKDDDYYKNLDAVFGISDGTSWSEYKDAIENAIQKYPPLYDGQCLDVDVIVAIIMQESSGVRTASSYKLNPNKGIMEGAKGLMQLENVNWDSFYEYGRKNYNQVWTEDDLFDPYKNIEYCVYSLAGIYSYYEGDYVKMIKAHNSGQGGVDRLIANYGDKWYEHEADLGGTPTYISGVATNYRKTGGNRQDILYFAR